MFADDIAICKEINSQSDQDMLQADLTHVFDWSHKWHKLELFKVRNNVYIL